VTVSRESDAVTSSTCRTNPPSNETIDVFYIKTIIFNSFHIIQYQLVALGHLLLFIYPIYFGLT